MTGYFDIHSHILPGVDDGAKDMEETRQMLLAAYVEGIRRIVATPHYMAGNKNVSKEKLIQIYEEVKLLAENVSRDFKILLGSELYYNSDLIDALDYGDALTIDGTRYILVEFSPYATFREIWEGINRCIFAGYIPILAHAERYQCLLSAPYLVNELIKSGSYIQLNLHNIIFKGFSKKAYVCHSLMKKGWVHFLGTDAHNPCERINIVSKAVAHINKKYGESAVMRLLWDNPMTLIEDRHLYLSEASKY